MEAVDETDAEHPAHEADAERPAVPAPRQDLGATLGGADFRKLGVRPTSATPLFEDSFALPSVGARARSKRLAAWKSSEGWPSRGIAVPRRWDSAAGRGASRSYPYRERGGAEFPGYVSFEFVGPRRARETRPHPGSESLLASAAREAGPIVDDAITLRDLATGRVRVPRGTILQRAEACSRTPARRPGGAAPGLVHQATDRHISLEAQQRHLTPAERQQRIGLCLELGISAAILDSDSDVESTGSFDG